MNKSVLVVDDDLMNRKMAQYILTKNGYEVVMVQSGEECLNLLETQVPDLILLDIEMPEMNGFELMEILQKIRDPKENTGYILNCGQKRGNRRKMFSDGGGRLYW